MRCQVCKGRGEIKAPVFIDYREATIYESQYERWVRCTACLGTGKVPQASATQAPHAPQEASIAMAV